VKITVFTSNQPRHISLIEKLSLICDEVYAIQECNTVFPGQVDDFFKKSTIMQEYFSYVIKAENTVFGDIRFSQKNVHSLSIKSGDLNKLSFATLNDALKSDLYIIFGSSYIRGPLCDFLVDKKAINIHMGLSPFYRGSSCNFWCLFDGRPEYVGATIHLLSKGLDSGPMLFHALPKAEAIDPFTLGMKAVEAAQLSLVDSIAKNEIYKLRPMPQDKSLELRYTKNIHFNDEVASQYLKAQLSPSEVLTRLTERKLDHLLNPKISHAKA
jgi:folate-dependent phosphoribosylglycinamide formyltransferase PurN